MNRCPVFFLCAMVIRNTRNICHLLKWKNDFGLRQVYSLLISVMNIDSPCRNHIYTLQHENKTSVLFLISNRGENKNDVGFRYFRYIEDKDAHIKQHEKVLKNLFQTSGSRILYLFLFRFGIRSKSGYQFPSKEKFLCFFKICIKKLACFSCIF